jgi:hypothetical protein
MSSLENDRRRAQRWVRCYPDELSLVAQQACEQVVKTLMSGLALHSLMESTVDHTDTLSCSMPKKKTEIEARILRANYRCPKWTQMNLFKTTLTNKLN